MYSGIIPALLTPFTSDDLVDTAMLSRLVAHFLDCGVAGLYICGSTGEGLLMTSLERRLVAETVISAVAGQIPVIIHIGAPSTKTAVKLAQHAKEAGADAISSIPPIYYVVGRPEIAAYYRSLKEAANLPLYFYNIPSLLNYSLDVELAKNLFAGGIIQGMKYTHHDFLTFRGIIDACDGNLNVFSGPDEKLLPFLVMGADGGIGTTYNCMPKTFVGIYNAWKNGEHEKAQKLQFKANQVITILAGYSMIPAVKAVMQMQGLDCGDPRGPFLPLTTDQKKQLEQQLTEVGFFEENWNEVDEL